MGPVLLASANPDKAAEIREVLAAASGEELVAEPLTVAGEIIGFVVAPPGDVASVIEGLPRPANPPNVEETAATLEGNARIKAQGVGRALGIATVADDTGLEVDALGGAPGVHAARYAGEDATYSDNVEKLLRALAVVDPDRRSARFATVALAWWPDGEEMVARGEVEGFIASAPRGESGFGYDPVFVPVEGDGLTFAEMAAEDKHRISHRGRAFRALAAKLAARA